MKLTVKILLGCAALLAASHGVAITTESRIAAQISWILIFGIIATLLLYLVETVYYRFRSGNAH